MNKLIIAEKPSVAKSIAAVLGATTKKDGYAVSVTGKLKGRFYGQ